MPFSWTESTASTPPDEVFTKGVIEYGKLIEKELDNLMKKRAKDITAWMKQNAIWKDRTKVARTGLKAELEFEINEIAIYMFYSDEAYYDIYLEFDHAGKYAILGPALDYWGPVLWNDVKALMAA